MSETRVITLVGSLRSDSINRRIAETLRDQAPAGVTIDIVDGLGEIPFYNEDLDGDQAPATACALRDQVDAADRVLLVTPEYNATMPAVLNNAIDWLSRPFGAGALGGKPVGVIGASMGRYGGQWAHEHARKSVEIAGGRVVEDVAISRPASGLDLDDGEFRGELAQALRVLLDAEDAEPAA